MYYFQNESIVSDILAVIRRKVHLIIQDNITSSIDHIVRCLRDVLNDFTDNVMPLHDFTIDIQENNNSQEIKISIYWGNGNEIRDYEINYVINNTNIDVGPIFEILGQWEGIIQRSQQQEENNNSNSLPEHLFMIE